MNIKTKITKLHYDRDAKGLFVTILEGASYFYGLGSGFKNWLYDKKILRPKKVPAFVISVGNMTTGGVGKTPVVLEIARYLHKKGEKVAIISRGYGGKLSNKKLSDRVFVLSVAKYRLNPLPSVHDDDTVNVYGVVSNALFLVIG